MTPTATTPPPSEPLDIKDWSRALTLDLREASRELEGAEIRYLVDAYYQSQEYRKRARNQYSAAESEPHLVISLIHSAHKGVEDAIRSALDNWTDNDHMGAWAKKHYGIGPVLSAGLAAHIDVTKANTAGAVWRFAGLDPTLVWGKGQKRPFNARLKVICWRIGDSFVKFHNRPECFYGHLYAERKLLEVARNDAGEFAETAKQTLEQKNIKDPATLERYNSGKLPDGRLDLRARRYAVKLFLAHWWEEAYRTHHGTEPPIPYPIAHLGHTHRINSPV